MLLCLPATRCCLPFLAFPFRNIPPNKRLRRSVQASNLSRPARLENEYREICACVIRRFDRDLICLSTTSHFNSFQSARPLRLRKSRPLILSFGVPRTEHSRESRSLDQKGKSDYETRISIYICLAGRAGFGACCSGSRPNIDHGVD